MSAAELTNALAGTAVLCLVLAALLGFAVAEVIDEERPKLISSRVALVSLGLAVLAGLAAIWVGAAAGVFK